MSDEIPPATDAVGKYLERWGEKLKSLSTILTKFKLEQRRGWESSALDAFYKNRSEMAVSSTQPGVDAAPTTSFHRSVVDIQQLCDRYRTHAKEILSRHSFFSTGSTTKHFIDLGAAPGGVSSFLALDLKWRGMAVSLAESNGGIAMAESVRSMGGEGTPSIVLLEKSILDRDLVSTIQALWPRVSCNSESRFADFVNCGAVQDHGQRSAAASGEQPTEALPWFTFLVPQLLAALQLVRRDGAGSIMVVFGMPSCGSIFLMLYALVKVLRVIPSFDDITFMETIHLTKPPVYVCMHRLNITDESITALTNLFTRGTIESGDPSLENATLFWTLQNPNDEAHAVEAFLECGKSLERVWEKATAYLETRRLKAERAFHRHSNSNSLKRYRGDETVNNH